MQTLLFLFKPFGKSCIDMIIEKERLWGIQKKDRHHKAEKENQGESPSKSGESIEGNKEEKYSKLRKSMYFLSNRNFHRFKKNSK